MRRSHATINGTTIARSHAARERQDAMSQKTKVGQMLAAADAKKFDIESVTSRLDRQNELDRLATERRMAAIPPPMDLGE